MAYTIFGYLHVVGLPVSTSKTNSQSIIDDVAQDLRHAGFRILLVFSLLIALAVILGPPENVLVASINVFIWIGTALLGLRFPSYGEAIAKLWTLIVIPVGAYLIIQNGLLPAALIPMVAIFPILLLRGTWRIGSGIFIVSCSFLVPLFHTEYNDALWLRMCITNFIVSLLIYTLSSRLEKALIESKLKSTALDEALVKERAALATQARFLATMSHEIRTPLNGILGLTDVVLSREINENARSHLEKIQRSGVSLNRILNDVLDVSKLKAGKLSLEAVAIDLKAVASDSVAFFSQLAQKKGIVLNLEIDERLNADVIGDATRLSQVLNNLISNAIKFTHVGSVTLRIMQGETSGSHQLVKFSVIDTGDGIDISDQERVFDAFTQANSSIQREFGGTGLGLQIVKSLVEAMGGTVNLRSELKQGSEFSFELPFSLPMNTPAKSVETPTGDITPSAFYGSILIADDNEINQVVAKALLEDIGFDVAQANNGREAVDMALHHQFDLILMDLNMPQMNGDEAANILRNHSISTPIIAFTAAVVKDELEKALAAGMNDYLTKPIDKDALHLILAKYLNSKTFSTNTDVEKAFNTA
ncbi:hypothetical protein KUC3_06570 [Alteromonas sp. KC3]|nr:hypothetical protein KUC3_06570 [Alteromonas sp. KC3]BCO21761.1 hypothetical protein KUC14_06300 [Alteromonas sp. KC14]